MKKNVQKFKYSLSTKGNIPVSFENPYYNENYNIYTQGQFQKRNNFKIKNP